MENINLPPFYVGQRVVVLKTGIRLNKYDVYVVLGIRKSTCKCQLWEVNVGVPARTGFMYCAVCGAEHIPNPTGVIWFNHNLFAPIQENFQQITCKEVEAIESPLISVN